MKTFSILVFGLAIAAANVFAAEKKIDIATIVTRSDAEKILGEAVTDAHAYNSDEHDGYYSKCNYHSTTSAKSLILRIHQANAEAVSPRKQFELLKKGGIVVKPISGVGDRAGVYSGPLENGTPAKSIMLYVADGHAFVTVGMTGVIDEVAAVDKAKGIARKILAKL